jgi:hypothetical protein
MNKKGISTLVIVGIVVIIIVVAGIAAYVLYSGGEEASPTPTPSGSPVEGATSMRFDVNATVDGAKEIDRFTVKNLGTSNVLIRVDQTDAQGNNFIYLMNQTAQSAWADAMGTGFVDDSANFASYWDSTLIGKAAVDMYMTALADWSGTGDYTGDTYVIYDIVVDPTLDDSVFVPT